MRYLHTKQLKKTVRASIAGMFAIVAISIAGLLISNPPSHAADTANFNPGNIIADSIFYNPSTMSVSDIQNFLNSKVPTCDSNHAGFTGDSGTVYNPQWICLKGFYENPDSTYTVNFNYKATNGSDQVGSRTYYNNNAYKYTSLTAVYKNGDYTQGIDHLTATIQNINGAIPSGAISAAQIIYNVAQQYGINPQVLIVLLQKEQSLVTDTWPYPGQYQSATGYGCPDVAPCSAGYAGFSKQLASAAWQFKNYQSNPSGFNYVANRNNTIKYNPNSACGDSVVFIQNQATAGLYNYTPYRPNNYALAGGSDSSYPNCGAFGNLNFWRYFNDWFGSSTLEVKSPFLDKYNSQGGANGNLGKPTMNQVCGIKDNGCYQSFEKGTTMYWSNATGTHTIAGGIRAKWVASGSEWGVLGFPISDELYGNKGGGAYQVFQGGRIYYTSAGKSYVIMNPIYDKWSAVGSEWGKLGYPTMDTVCGIRNSGCYQIFQDGSSIYWSPASGGHTIAGGIRAKWAANRGEWSPLGYPTSDELYGNKDGGAYQVFQEGRIYYTNNGKSYIILNDIYEPWSAAGAERGSFGYPLNDSFCGSRYGGCYQTFQNDITMFTTEATGMHTISGGIRSAWAANGSEWGKLGYPTSNELYNTNGAYQTFQGGTIYWPFNAPYSVVYN